MTTRKPTDVPRRGGRRPGAGRPCSDRTERVTAMLTPADAARVAALCAERGISRGELLTLCLDSLERSS